ncbi:MAG TPA: hypothetical protein VFQ84_07460 [Arenimonas sp.]|uniref:hypothetical protein n=1 Tax=Arenimonas sp. TaxID=1872635 RepID=UPI002D800697|nr:hypothetical protein [Arenimonas sp.]HEU0153164.1 hypothetical protein [Arenimonas sp.]
MKTRLVLAISLALAAHAASATQLSSVSQLAFGPDDVLFIADWKQSSIHAVELPASRADAGKTFNIRDLDSVLTSALGPGVLAIEDLAVRPGTGEAYIAVSVGEAKVPAIVVVTSDGMATKLDVAAAQASRYAIDDAPKDQTEFWHEIPERSFTVTDMKWYDGELFVAGLSNQDFASTLRRIPYPFTGKETTTSVEIYHTSHNQIETRAPIRTMAIANVGGTPTLIAAYTCTPLVTIPLADLKAGAHVRGKTIAELGYGNTPADLLHYQMTADGKTVDYLFLTNLNRSSDVIPLASVEAAAAKPGMSTYVEFGKITGVDTMQAPMAGAIRTDNLDANFLLTARRDLATGKSELVSVTKFGFFRLSDFVSEYNFPEYSYTNEFQRTQIKPVQDALMTQEGFADEIRK